MRKVYSHHPSIHQFIVHPPSTVPASCSVCTVNEKLQILTSEREEQQIQQPVKMCQVTHTTFTCGHGSKERINCARRAGRERCGTKCTPTKMFCAEPEWCRRCERAETEPTQRVQETYAALKVRARTRSIKFSRKSHGWSRNRKVKDWWMERAVADIREDFPLV